MAPSRGMYAGGSTYRSPSRVALECGDPSAVIDASVQRAPASKDPMCQPVGDAEADQRLQLGAYGFWACALACVAARARLGQHDCGRPGVLR